MLKRDITYENPFTEQPVTEAHYFHISKADLVEMEIEEHNTTYISKNGEEMTGMRAALQRIGESEDGKTILEGFRDIIRRAYGIKDGDRFRKSKAISEDFLSSEAFSQLLFDICTQPELAGEFINGVIPGNLEQITAEVQAQAERVAAGREAQEQAKAAATSPDGGTPEVEAVEPRVLTADQARDMDPAKLRNGLAEGRFTLQ